MILLQSSLPCSENFYRYKKNYEKYVNSGTKSDGGSSTPTDAEKAGIRRKTIASPKIMNKLSPLNTFISKTNINATPAS
jgi:hypothetical protein